MSHLAVVTAGLGAPSSSRLLGDRLAAATNAALGEGALPVLPIELRDLAVDLATAATTGLPAERVREAFRTIGTAAGVIVVTPVMNGGPSGLFKLFFDLLDEGAMRGRPVLLGATGGTVRHSLAIDRAMLPMFFYLKALVSPTAVFAATDDWGSADAGLAARIEAAGADFADLMTARPASDQPDEFAHVRSFSDLLGG